MATIEAAGIDRLDSDVSIMAADGADRISLEKDLDTIVKDLPIVSVHDKASFSESVRGQINQLLYMIYGLLALAVVIAVIGIVNTLGLSVLERTREIGLLRAVGLSRAKLRRMVTLESVAIALLGAVLGLSVGLVIGVLLRQSLADDITELALPLPSLAVFMVVAVLFGILAAPDLADPKVGSADGGLQYIVLSVLGGPFGKAFLACIVVAVVVCTSSLHELCYPRISRSSPRITSAMVRIPCSMRSSSTNENDSRS